MTRLLELAGAHHLLVRLPPPALPARGLTPAERAVVEAALAGLSNADIARARSTSTRTIANQLSSAYKKLGVRSRGALAHKLCEPSEQNDLTTRELLTGSWTLAEHADSGERRWAIARPSPTRLEPSELRALALRAKGASLATIAHDLGVSEATASRRAKSGMQKLGVSTVTELARLLAERS